jgi:hypothetical protein
MSNIINLNKARKSRSKETKQAQAAENTVKFGRTKAQKSLERARAEKARRDLDGAERED